MWLLLLTTTLSFASALCKVEVSAGYQKLGSVDRGVRELEIAIGKEIRTLKLSEHSMGAPAKRPSNKNAIVQVYQTIDQSVICIEECNVNDPTICESRCLIETDTKYVYIKDNRTMTVRSREGAGCSPTETFADFKEPMQERSSVSKRHRRETEEEGSRSHFLIPNIQTNTAVVKVRFMADVALLHRFIDFVDTGVLQDAKDEMERFFILLLNRVNLYFRSLNEMGKTFKSNDDKIFPVNFAFSLESIVYPKQNKAGVLEDLDSVEANKKNGSLVADIILGEDNTAEVAGVVSGFQTYMSSVYESVQQPFDILHFMTGDDFRLDYYQKKRNETVFLQSERRSGIAGYGVMCVLNHPNKTDKRFSISSMNHHSIARIVTHLLAHNLGAGHDNSEECPPDANTVMVRTSPPVTANFAEFYNWSVCSAREIADHFAHFSSEELSACLYTDRPTKAEFQKQFCAGILGQRYGINDHCHMFGKDSFLCTEGDANLAAGFVAVDQCVTSQESKGFRPILRCAINGSCSGQTHEIKQLFDGTKCRKDDDDEDEKICFEGKCRLVGEICDELDDRDDEDDDENDD